MGVFGDNVYVIHLEHATLQSARVLTATMAGRGTAQPVAPNVAPAQRVQQESPFKQLFSIAQVLHIVVLRQFVEANGLLQTAGNFLLDNSSVWYRHFVYWKSGLPIS